MRLQTGSRPLLGNLYRGVTSPLAAVVPSWCVNFALYGSGLKALGSSDLPAVRGLLGVGAG